METGAVKKHKVLFVLGGPGSGKGTMCERMVEQYGFVHFSTGDLLRAEVSKKSELGLEIDSYISKGDLVPGDIAVKLLKVRIQSGSTDDVHIIDGYPRNQSNIDFWNEVVGDEINVKGCIFLEASDEIMKQRILSRGKDSGRSDDNEEVFNKRIQVYHDETQPILTYYEDQKKLFKVSANGTKDECFVEVESVLKTLHLSQFKKLKKMKDYLNLKVDKFVKPLVVYLMKN